MDKKAEGMFDSLKKLPGSLRNKLILTALGTGAIAGLGAGIPIALAQSSARKKDQELQAFLHGFQRIAPGQYVYTKSSK